MLGKSLARDDLVLAVRDAFSGAVGLEGVGLGARPLQASI